MNVLLIGAARGPDYLTNMLLHGFRTAWGPAAVDFPRVPYMYSDYSDCTHLYGRGFTLYGLLGDDSAVDRLNIKERISSRAFDYIVYTSIQRDHSMLPLVTTNYPRHRVLLIDGEDQPHLLYNLTRQGLYFKRELVSPQSGIFPIHFAIPAAKLYTQRSTPKSQVRAFIDPRDRSTYIYRDEASYYADYARSLFAFTCRKAGWDQLRTLEILANRCIPLFLDLADCPEWTCVNLPKAELLEALAYADRDGAYWESDEGRSVWLSLWRRIHLKFVTRSTTERLAQYIIEVAQREEPRAA